MMYYIVLYHISKRTQRIYLLANNFDLLVEKIFLSMKCYELMLPKIVYLVEMSKTLDFSNN